MLNRVGFFAAALGVTLAACGDSSPAGPGGGPAGGAPTVSIGFRSAGAGSASATVLPGTLRASQSGLAASVTLGGSNGSLMLDGVWFIVDEFELKRVNHDDCDGVINQDACEKFEAAPQFIQLPLESGTVPIVTQAVPPDLYDELDFEIEDISLDDSEENAQEIQTLFDAIRAEFADWPEDASLLVTGSFTPAGGDPVSFRVFFEAEIEIEIEFGVPLAITQDNGATVTVVVDPALWFSRPDGTVMDLSQFEGQLVEFEVEMENGFTEIEFDD